MFSRLFYTLCSIIAFTNVNAKYTREQQMKDQFDDFLKIHKKHYSSPVEYQEHFDIFHANLNRIKSYVNEDGKACKMYLTKYSDITTDKSFDYDTCKKNPIFERVKEF